MIFSDFSRPKIRKSSKLVANLVPLKLLTGMKRGKALSVESEWLSELFGSGVLSVTSRVEGFFV